MTSVRLGGVISALDAFGPAPRSDWRGPRPEGNDFHHRFPEDLSLLGELGVTVARLGFDWARLQPAPGTIDDDWREWYEHVLEAADRAGIGVWATLHESTVPAWFDDEGSFADSRTAGRWWPRWVETCADLFGDRVAGWFPIHDPIGAAARWAGDPRKHEAALVSMAVAWRDAWRILRGGPPVATSLVVQTMRAADRTVPAAQAARWEDHLRWRLWMRALRDGVLHLPNGAEHVIADLGSSLDLVGVATALDLPEARVCDESLEAWAERLGSLVRRAAEDGPDRPLVISGLEIAWAQPEECRLLVEATVHALDDARDDGVPLETVHVMPAIASDRVEARPSAALVDRDRNVTVFTPTWQALTKLGGQ